MNIDEEIKLRAEIASKHFEVIFVNADRINHINAYEAALESANKIVDNAIEKSYEVKKNG